MQTFGQLVKGDEEFATRILEQSPEPEVVRRALSVDRVSRVVAQVLDMKVEDLRGVQRSRDLSSARAIAAYVGRELGRISLSRMAEHLRRHRSTLVRDVQRLEGRLDQTTELRKKVVAIMKRLPAQL